MTHAFVTIAIPFASERRQDVESLLDRMGNPPAADIKERLDATSAVHFISIHAIYCPSAENDRLVIEATADGGPNQAIEVIAGALGPELRRLLATAEVDIGTMTLEQALTIYALDVGPDWRQTPGLIFDGSPTLSVRRIKNENRLAAKILTEQAAVLADDGAAATRLDRIRNWLWSEGEKWAFEAEPTPFLRGGIERTLPVKIRVAFSAFLHMLGPGLLLLLVVLWVSAGFSAGTLLLLMLVGAGVGGIILLLRRAEMRDVPDDSPPSPTVMAKVAEHENWGAQNLLAACSILKPERSLRLCTLRFAFNLTTRGVAMVYRPGNLRSIDVIHFARWVLLPGTDNLLFFSNFSGGWESYLEDFIVKAPDGLTSVWSNTKGFPRTRFLFLDGATDGPRFRRWARRQQIPARFWYSAYPDLRTTRIRLNAAIRDGIASAHTDEEAQAWLALFGSAPIPSTRLDKPEIPTLVFGALRHLRHSACLTLRLSDDPAQARAWLRELAPEITYGEHSRDRRHALSVGFSADGLRRLGLHEDALQTFPIAFQQGMPARARVLGDLGPDEPEIWLWGNEARPADALLYIYADSADALDDALAELVRHAGLFGHVETFRRILKELPPRHAPIYEPFGFRDGISQPIIRGTPRGEKRTQDPNPDIHIVEAGEFVLGYPDNGGTVAPTPSVAVECDPAGLLRPGEQPGRRDLGSNGTFMAVRDLEQDPEGLRLALDHAAQLPEMQAFHTRARYPDSLQDVIAAKMVGRWKSGASLVAHPQHDPGQGARADNEFTFNDTDPAGLRCPFGAHVRRANPRDSVDNTGGDALALTRRHRILRVGRSYGPPQEGGKPGLLFTCLNAEFERQFEFVQQSWINGRNFHELPDEADPIVSGPGCFTIPTKHGPVNLTGLRDFVTLRGGGYFFMPSRTTIRFLASER